MLAGLDRINWYVRRLSVMSPAEIMHRVGEQLVVKQMHARQMILPSPFRSSRSGSAYAFCRSQTSQVPELPWDFDPAAAAVDELLAGRGRAMNCAWSWHGGDSAWHVAPDTGKVWPRTFFASIPYREGNAYGDVRLVWEPGRLQDMVTLALTARSTEGKRARDAVHALKDVFTSWYEQNPPFIGVHYISAMECGLRILSVCYAFDIARNHIPAEEDIWGRVAALMESHARFIFRRLSLHSSAGNHTIAECVGLVYAGTLFPEFKEAALWRERGLEILDKEARRQILADGGSIEQAFWYLLFVVDLLGLTERLLRHVGQSVPEGVAEAVERGRRFLTAFSRAPEDLPQIGDRDGGYALSPYLRLAFAETDGHGPNSRTPNTVSTFEQSGYTLINSMCEEEPVEIIFDHGSLGMFPSCGHGHADALSLVLKVGGQAVLVDPGTYTYTGDMRWRRYFRSTRAHNTVVVEGADQARQESAFMWSRPYSARYLQLSVNDPSVVAFAAEHDGYQSIGVIHRRAVLWDADRGTCIVLDRLLGSDVRRLELNWHLGLPVREDTDGAIVSASDGRIRIALSGGRTALLRAQGDETVGWRSDSYGQRSAACVVRMEYTGQLPHEFLTVLRLGEPQQDTRIEEAHIHRVREVLNDAGSR